MTASPRDEQAEVTGLTALCQAEQNRRCRRGKVTVRKYEQLQMPRGHLPMAWCSK